MSNGVLVAEVSPWAEATSRKPVPAVVTRRSVNVATPFTAATVNEPANVPLPVPKPMVTEAELDTGFPKSSVTSTSTAGVIGRSAALNDGGTLNARRVGCPAAAVAVKTMLCPGTLGEETVSV
jgi:hypothetical protein